MRAGQDAEIEYCTSTREELEELLNLKASGTDRAMPK